MEIEARSPRQYKMSGTRSRGTWAGDRCYPTASKVHRRQLVAVLVLTLLRKPDAKATDPIHRCTVGLDVTSTAVENRSRLNSWGSSCGAGAHRAPGVAASPQTVDLLNKFRAFASATAVPSHCPTNWPTSPRLWRHLRAGLAAMKIHLLWDSSPARSSNCESPPSAPATLPTRSPKRSPRPGRCRCSTWATSVWIGPEPHAGRCFLDLSAAAWHVGLDAQGQPWRCAIPAAADRVGTDRRVGPAGREPSPALPIDRSAGAPRGGRPEATESLREGPEAWPRAGGSISNGRTGRSS